MNYLSWLPNSGCHNSGWLLELWTICPDFLSVSGCTPLQVHSVEPVHSCFWFLCLKINLHLCLIKNPNLFACSWWVVYICLFYFSFLLLLHFIVATFPWDWWQTHHCLSFLALCKLLCQTVRPTEACSLPETHTEACSLSDRPTLRHVLYQTVRPGMFNHGHFHITLTK